MKNLALRRRQPIFAAMLTGFLLHDWLAASGDSRLEDRRGVEHGKAP